MPQEWPGYWYSRWLFERGLAVIYLVGFLVVVHQFLPLLGERGLLPAVRFVKEVPFRVSPSIFYWFNSDRAFQLCGWIGVALSARNLTCLDYFFETQPMPNPVSWYMRHLPKSVLHGGVAFNHFVELIVPFGFFLPQPWAGIAGLFTIVFQVILISGGNLSWLNWLTLILAITTLDDRFLSWLPVARPALQPIPTGQRGLTMALAVVVALLSIPPALNMLSPGQVMNTSFNPLQIVNTYGAFGSITKERYEIVVEGTDAETIDRNTVWRAYEFKGKPDDPSRRPPQYAPYHLRLDWLMWFAAMSTPNEHPWFPQLLLKFLEGDSAVLGLLRTNPFPDHPPRWIRAQLYLYRFTSPEERRRTGHWWERTVVAPYFPEVKLSR